VLQINSVKFLVLSRQQPSIWGSYCIDVQIHSRDRE